MPTLRVFANYLLWRVHRRRVLPGYFIARIPVVECGEPLEPIGLIAGRLAVDNRHGYTLHARTAVIVALRKAALSLPEGLQLLIVDAYRSPQIQQQLWDEEIQAAAKQYSDATQDEIERVANVSVAHPGAGGGGHQTGGAVDVTLADSSGRELPMGTAVDEVCSMSATHAKVGDVERRNRETLANAMTWAGFVNYPAEWWHYSVGDQMWSAYGHRRRTARYGQVKELGRHLSEPP
jgi:D-alanyl-D-alanine dipeptidase